MHPRNRILSLSSGYLESSNQKCISTRFYQGHYFRQSTIPIPSHLLLSVPCQMPFKLVQMIVWRLAHNISIEHPQLFGFLTHFRSFQQALPALEVRFPGKQIKLYSSTLYNFPQPHTHARTRYAKLSSINRRRHKIRSQSQNHI